MEQKTLLKNKKNQGNGGETMAKRDDSVKKKVPELRFKGFTDDWEQRKLGELSNIVGGGTPSTSNSEYWDGDIDWYAPAEIGEQRYVSKSKKTITELGLKKSSARILPVGTVLFTSRAGIGNTAILGKEATTNQGFQSIVPNPNKLDSYFIYSRTNELKRYGEVTGTGSTFVEVSGKQMSKMPIMIPELSEQKKIGSFFEQLDNTIALHQRKLDLLKEQKKGYLQKMFPKNGEKVPELRFAGFADDWEQRKAGDIFKNVSDKGYSDLPVLSASQELGMIRRDEIGIDIKYDEASTKNYKRVQPGQFVIHLRSFQGGFAWSDIEGITSPAYTVLDYKEPNRYNSDFWKVVLTSPTFITRLETVTYGIRDGRSISYTDFSSLKLTAPSLAEQQQIGAFFAHLDTLISLHQRKLDLLKELKKALLRQLFV